VTLVPLWLPKVVAIAAGTVFVFGSDAGRNSKLLMAAVVLLSLVLQHGFGSVVASTAGLVLQVAASVFVLLYFKATS
jgi:hypothetical protein